MSAGRAPSPRLAARLASSDPALLAARSEAGQELRRSLARDATVVAIGVGYEGKRPIYERLAELGATLVLVDGPGNWASALADEGVAARFVPIDRPGLEAGTAAGAILAALEGIEVDAVLTFWEDCVPVTARVAAALGLPGNDVQAVEHARSKRLMRAATESSGIASPRFASLETAADLAGAAAHVGFPAILKPEFGAEAYGCFRVDSVEELEEAFARIKPTISPEHDPIFLQGTTMLLEQYLDGVEFDVDLLLSSGECVFAGVAENWPTSEPYFLETGLHSPSSYPADRLAELQECCIAAARALGLTTGVLHVEAKYTSAGPRVLEVNARLGGTTVRDNHRFVHGVDLAEEHLLASLGLPVRPPVAPEPRCGVCEVILQADRSGTIQGTEFLDALAADPRVFYLDAEVTAGDRVTGPADGFPTVLADVGLREDDGPAAIAALTGLVAALSIPYA